MAILVELDVYSGAPNPIWVLTGVQERKVRRRIMNKRAVSMSHPAQGMLGYRGFIVRDTDPKAAGDRVFNLARYKQASVRSGAHGTRAGKTNKISGAPEIEEFLLRTAEDAVDPELRRYVQGAIEELPLKVASAKSGCPSCVAADAPAYSPAPWNVNPVVSQNNCYNYANNQITNTFAQPGRATGTPITAMSCAGCQSSAQSDGLTVASNFSSALSSGKGWYVALVIWPGRDYHWYRQDTVGCWSHKPGRTPVVNTDNAGATIADPSTCSRLPYAVFCAYMVSRSGVRIS